MYRGGAETRRTAKSKSTPQPQRTWKNTEKSAKILRGLRRFQPIVDREVSKKKRDTLKITQHIPLKF